MKKLDSVMLSGALDRPVQGATKLLCSSSYMVGAKAAAEIVRSTQDDRGWFFHTLGGFPQVGAAGPSGAPWQAAKSDSRADEASHMGRLLSPGGLAKQTRPVVRPAVELPAEEVIGRRQVPKPYCVDALANHVSEVLKNRGQPQDRLLLTKL